MGARGVLCVLNRGCYYPPYSDYHRAMHEAAVSHAATTVTPFAFALACRPTASVNGLEGLSLWR